MIALARTYLSIASLTAIYLDPTEPARYADLTHRLLVGYALYSLLALAVVRGARSAAWAGLACHVIDLASAAVISLFTAGPNSPFFLYFAFVLVAAAYRWGSRGTWFTTFAALALLVLLAVFLADPPLLGLRSRLEGRFALNLFLMRAVYLLLMGYLLGSLGDSEQRLRREAAAIADLLARIRPGADIRTLMHAVLERLAALFGAAGVIVVVRDLAAQRAYLWEATQTLRGGIGVLRVRELEPWEWDDHLLGWRSDAALSIRDAEGRPRYTALDPRGERCSDRPALPAGALPGRAFHRLLAAPLAAAGEWSGWLLLLDPARGRSGEAELRFLQRLLRETVPALHGAYLVRRLRSRIGAAERARIARELHDGLIQSLIGLELRLAALRRAPPEAAALAGEIEEIRSLLRSEVLSARELMAQMKPLDVGPREVLDVLAQSVARFRRDTGIAAEFIADVPELELPPRTGREVTRIVQEALANVRRHSAARNVLVRVGVESGALRLIVDDDGRGFEFSGRKSGAELEALRLGPAVIKERVRAVAGELTIDSEPGRGARLEIRVPAAAHA